MHRLDAGNFRVKIDKPAGQYVDYWEACGPPSSSGGSFSEECHDPTATSWSWECRDPTATAWWGGGAEAVAGTGEPTAFVRITWDAEKCAPLSPAAAAAVRVLNGTLRCCRVCARKSGLSENGVEAISVGSTGTLRCCYVSAPDCPRGALPPEESIYYKRRASASEHTNGVGVSIRRSGP